MSKQYVFELKPKAVFLLLVYANLLIVFDQIIVVQLIPFEIFTAFIVSLLLYLTLFCSHILVVLIIAVIGLFFDMQSSAVFGPGMFSALCLYLLFSYLAPLLYLSSNFVVISVSSCAVGFFYFSNFLVKKLFSLPVNFDWKELLLMALLTGLVTPLIFKLTHRLVRL